MESGPTNTAFRWGIERQPELGSFRKSHVNRDVLMNAFRLLVDQTSTDLSRDPGMAPKSMTRDKSARTCVQGTRFESTFLKIAHDRRWLYGAAPKDNTRCLQACVV